MGRDGEFKENEWEIDWIKVPTLQEEDKKRREFEKRSKKNKFFVLQ